MEDQNKIPHQMEDKNKILHQIIGEEITGLYKQIYTTCIAFLGWTLVFHENLFDSSSAFSRISLVSGWVFLIISLILLVYIRGGNAESHEHMLQHNEQNTKDATDSLRESERISKNVEQNTKWSVRLMILGIIVISINVAISILKDIF